MISYEQANDIIEKEFESLKLQTEEVELLSSVNRVLAEDIISDIDLPPFTNSAMDGFAIKFSPDVKKWKIIGEISAGNFKDFEVGSGLAVGIMTGGKMPSTADTVVPVEDVIIENDSILLKDTLKLRKGINVRLKGNDLQTGRIALTKNTLIKPNHVAVAASCGKDKIKVFRKLKFGVLATGDELVDINTPPADDKIRSSNLYSLLAAISSLNQEGVNLGVTKDNENEITDRIKSFLAGDIDILITTGGVSVGKYDYVKAVMEKLGINFNFWKANIKPGKPVVFGTYKKDGSTKFIFGLPGNPVSCLVNFMIFVANNIQKLFGLPSDNTFTAELTEDLKKKDGKKHFVRGLYYKSKEGKLFVKREGSQSSGNLAEMGKSNCLIIFNEDRKEIKTGEEVICIPV